MTPDVIAGLVKKAKAGDVKAIEMFLKIAHDWVAPDKETATNIQINNTKQVIKIGDKEIEF